MHTDTPGMPGLHEKLINTGDTTPRPDSPRRQAFVSALPWVGFFSQFLAYILTTVAPSLTGRLQTACDWAALGAGILALVAYLPLLVGFWMLINRMWRRGHPASGYATNFFTTCAVERPLAVLMAVWIARCRLAGPMSPGLAWCMAALMLSRALHRDVHMDWMTEFKWSPLNTPIKAFLNLAGWNAICDKLGGGMRVRAHVQQGSDRVAVMEKWTGPWMDR